MLPAARPDSTSEDPHGGRFGPAPDGAGEQALRGVARAPGRRPRSRCGRGRGGAGPVWLGKVHPVPHHQPAGDDRQRHDPARRATTAERGQGAGPAALRRRHGVPAVQPVRAQERARQRDARAGQGPRPAAQGGRAARTRAARARRRRGPGGQAAGAALRRAAAAGGDRPGARHGPQADPLRRADLRPGPGDDQRGPGRDAEPRRGGDDHGGGQPRDGLHQVRGQPGGLHGRRPHPRAGAAGAVLQQPDDRAREGLPVQGPEPLKILYHREPLGEVRFEMRARRVLGMLAATVVLALAATACGGDSGGSTNKGTKFPEGSTMAKLQQAGKVTVGTKVDPGEMGISRDNIEWVETVSANREPFIQQGKVDFVVATYTINDKRKQVVDFAGPYYVAGQDIMVKKGNPLGIRGPDDLAGKRVCSVTGSTPAENIRTNYPQAKLTEFDVYSKCAEALKNGQLGLRVVGADVLRGGRA